jgi:small subunit ribosomal protein S20
MANHPSAEKRYRQNVKRRARNRHHTSTMRTTVKRVVAAIEAKDVNAARTALDAATRSIARTAQRGVIKDETASRKISRLTKAVNRLGTAG